MGEGGGDLIVAIACGRSALGACIRTPLWGMLVGREGKGGREGGRSEEGREEEGEERRGRGGGGGERIRPYRNGGGEVDFYRLELTLNELGKAFLVVDRFAMEGGRLLTS